jgi:hypothetical protein
VTHNVISSPDLEHGQVGVFKALMLKGLAFNRGYQCAGLEQRRDRAGGPPRGAP